ncbi:MAG: hypothetical protein ABR548_12580 [Actinomycetota bacterium]
MSTAKKTLYATIGAGELAIEKTRDLSSRLIELPAQLGRRGSLRELPKLASSIRTEAPKRVSAIVTGGTDVLKSGTSKTQELVAEARKRSTKQYQELAKRGEKLYGSIKRSQPTKQAASQGKSAKSKVKAASTSVAKAKTAATDAVVSAAEKVEEATA